MQEVHPSDPSIADVIHEDTVPAVVFVLGILRVPFRINRQVLYTTFRNLPRVIGFDDETAAICLGEGSGDRCVKGDGGTIDSRDSTVP